VGEVQHIQSTIRIISFRTGRVSPLGKRSPSVVRRSRSRNRKAVAGAQPMTSTRRSVWAHCDSLICSSGSCRQIPRAAGRKRGWSSRRSDAWLAPRQRRSSSSCGASRITPDSNGSSPCVASLRAPSRRCPPCSSPGTGHRSAGSRNSPAPSPPHTSSRGATGFKSWSWTKSVAPW